MLCTDFCGLIVPEQHHLREESVDPDLDGAAAGWLWSIFGSYFSERYLPMISYYLFLQKLGGGCAF